MGKSSKDKIEFAKILLEKGIPYREIQRRLKHKFGNGMSNTTLKNIGKIQNKVIKQEERIVQLEKELSLFKKLFFELSDAIQQGEKDGRNKEKGKDLKK